eukprot:1841092-Rhodomonas_salina.1
MSDQRGRARRTPEAAPSPHHPTRDSESERGAGAGSDTLWTRALAGAPSAGHGTCELKVGRRALAGRGVWLGLRQVPQEAWARRCAAARRQPAGTVGQSA